MSAVADQFAENIDLLRGLKRIHAVVGGCHNDNPRTGRSNVTDARRFPRIEILSQWSVATLPRAMSKR
jgi:hypothetical protein